MKSIIASLIGFLLPAAVAITIGGESSFVTNHSTIFMIFLIAFAIQWVAFIPAYLLKTEKFYDLTGGVTFMITTWVAWMAIDQAPMLNTILAISITIWALRLSLFLFFRVRKTGEDARFNEIKRSAPRFFLTWTLQGTWVSLTLAPVIVLLTTNTKNDLPILSIIGVFLWLLGLLIEVVADLQKSKFKADPLNHHRFISSGLWSFSRHPNYFGEWLLWVGISIIALPFLSGWQFVSLISPVFIFILLTKISGVPLLEKKAEEKWGADAEYRVYVDTVPVFFPKILK